MDTRSALQLVLDQVDYTRGACTVTEMVGAVLPEETIAMARASLAEAYTKALQFIDMPVDDIVKAIYEKYSEALPDMSQEDLAKVIKIVFEYEGSFL
jgi:dihydrodipicolinate synthase/N-acetylneuraminate lyase